MEMALNRDRVWHQYVRVLGENVVGWDGERGGETGSETGTRAGKGELRGNRGAPALKTSRPSPHLRPRVPFADLRRALSDAGGLRGLYAGHGMNVVREAVFGAIYLGGTVY